MSVSLIDGHDDAVALKPCPFCGGEAVFVPLSGCSGKIACIGDCHFESAKFWDNMLDHEEGKKWNEKAIEVWNRRADDARKTD